MAETYAQKNQEFWNNAAEAVHKATWVHDLHAQVQSFLKANIDWLPPKDDRGKTTARLMDYACGSGIVSRSLQPHFSQCVGVDLADGMLAKYRATAAELGLSEAQMMGVQGDLLAPTVKATNPPLSEEQLSNFDVVAICLALHHVDDVELAAKRLAERLRPGGVLLIIDWATRENEAEGAAHQRDHAAHADAGRHHEHHHHHRQIRPHEASHTVSHDSFTKEQIFGILEKAGCCNSSFVLADRLSDVPVAVSGKMQLFFARATKV